MEAGHPARQRPSTHRTSIKPQTNTNTKYPATQPNSAPQTPFNEDAFAQQIGDQVDKQIATLQTAVAAQFEGPFVDTIKHVVNDELLSNNAYAIALKDHFATFDHSKFTRRLRAYANAFLWWLQWV
jgi:hypothetical protein